MLVKPYFHFAQFHPQRNWMAFTSHLLFLFIHILRMLHPFPPTQHHAFLVLFTWIPAVSVKSLLEIWINITLHSQYQCTFCFIWSVIIHQLVLVNYLNGWCHAFTLPTNFKFLYFVLIPWLDNLWLVKLLSHISMSCLAHHCWFMT